MRKKTIMLGLYGIVQILLLLTAALQFATYSKSMIYKNKGELRAKWSTLNTDEVIDTLYTISDEISTDLALMLISDDGNINFYRTERERSFIQIEDLAPDRVYATHPQDGQEQLQGFFFLTDDHFCIAPLRTLKGSKTELFTTTILVESMNMPALLNALEQHGAQVGATGAPSGGFPATGYVPLLALFFLFLITVVFYAFSRAKDMIVKKTLGYGNRDIVLAELRQLGRSLLLISVALLLLAAILFFLLAGLSSTLLFFQKSFLAYYFYYVLTMLLIVFCLNSVSARCSISSSKGKSLNRQLYICTVVFKSVLSWALAVLLSSTFSDVGRLLELHRNTAQAAALADGYAWAVPYTNASYQPWACPEQYIPRIYAVYREWYDSHNLIVAAFSDSIYADQLIADRGGDVAAFTASINDHYLDTFDTVYGMDGAPIHADQIVKGKSNMLIPHDYDTDLYFEEYPGLQREDFHFIRYDAAKSKFFTFSNELEGGYAFCGEIPLLIFIHDAGEYMEDKDPQMQLVGASLLYNSVFLYDTTSELSPYEQILPLLQENGLDQYYGPAVAVKQEFLRPIKYCKDNITLHVSRALIILFALLALVFKSTELYYRVYAKEIAVKLISGYSFMDLFSLRMALKTALLPALILMPDVSIPAALFCVSADLGLFVLCIRRNIRRNVAGVMKGE